MRSRMFYDFRFLGSIDGREFIYLSIWLIKYGVWIETKMILI